MDFIRKVEDAVEDLRRAAGNWLLRGDGSVEADPEPPTESPAPLSTRDKQLIEVFGRVQQRGRTRPQHSLEEMYLGAGTVLRSGHPHAGAQASLSAREIMEAMPKQFGIFPAKRLGTRVAELRKRWAELTDQSDAHTSTGIWAGAIDAPLQQLLLECEDFLDKKDDHRPAIEAMFTQNDASGQDLAPAVLGPRVENWLSLLKFFNQSLHGSSSAPVADVSKNLDRLADLILDWLRPTPSQHLPEIDSILTEGPPRE